MKKIMAMVMVVLVIAGLFAVVSYIEHNYTRKDCTVIASTESGMLIEDTCGFTWYWEGESYPVGTKVDLHMYTDVTTSYVFDDEIIGVRVQK